MFCIEYRAFLFQSLLTPYLKWRNNNFNVRIFFNFVFDKIMENARLSNSELSFCWYRLPESNSICLASLGVKSSEIPHGPYFTAQSFNFYKSPEFQYFPLLNSTYFDIHSAPETFPLPLFSLNEFLGEATLKADFIQFVNASKHIFKHSSIRKIVASRTHFMTYEKVPDLYTSFLKLCEAYPHSFICLYAHPETGMWLSASPELFIKMENTSIKTVSLAGTRNKLETDTEWGEKELEEQAIVSRYQEKLWQDLGIFDVEIDGPKNLDLKTIQHLITSYTGKVKNTSVYSKMAFEMHPTPAVGGFPKADSLRFIEENEKHDREMYAGFFGIGNGVDKIETYVQLRTARIYENGILYYAGAGITEGSDAELEWIETENKCKILSNFL